jgi:hypothetical protein
MPGETTAWRQQPALQWTPHLIKRLRGKRMQAEFGALLGAPKNTVWRWEAGQAYPDARYAAGLSALAEREHFLTDWQLVGSMTLLGALESARVDIAKLLRRSLDRTSRRLAE